MAATAKFKFERMNGYEERAKLLGEKIEEHTGYFRHNDGSWVICDSEGTGTITVRFMGEAKRGQGYNAPDPEGQALARKIVLAVNNFDALLEACKDVLVHVEDDQERMPESMCRLCYSHRKALRDAIAAAESKP